jgi:hypothetical protein
VFLLNPATMTMSVPGRAKKIQKSDARAQGNNPRFPWQPSTTMLTHRLTGTTEAFGVLPERTTPSSSPTTVVTRARSQTQPPRESSRPTASPKGSKLLIQDLALTHLAAPPILKCQFLGYRSAFTHSQLHRRQAYPPRLTGRGRHTATRAFSNDSSIPTTRAFPMRHRRVDEQKSPRLR